MLYTKSAKRFAAVVSVAFMAGTVLLTPAEADAAVNTRTAEYIQATNRAIIDDLQFSGTTDLIGNIGYFLPGELYGIHPSAITITFSDDSGVSSGTTPVAYGAAGRMTAYGDTQFAYDAQGTLIRYGYPYHDEETGEDSFYTAELPPEYSSENPGLLTSVYTFEEHEVESPYAFRIYISYDDSGRIVRMESYDVADGNPVRVGTSLLTYNADNTINNITSYGYYDDGQADEGLVEMYKYNKLGEILIVSTSDGSVIQKNSYKKDGTLTAMTYPDDGIRYTLTY